MDTLKRLSWKVAINWYGALDSCQALDSGLSIRFTGSCWHHPALPNPPSEHRHTLSVIPVEWWFKCREILPMETLLPTRTHQTPYLFLHLLCGPRREVPTEWQFQAAYPLPVSLSFLFVRYFCLEEKGLLAAVVTSTCFLRGSLWTRSWKCLGGKPMLRCSWLLFGSQQAVCSFPSSPTSTAWPHISDTNTFFKYHILEHSYTPHQACPRDFWIMNESFLN